MNDLHSLYSPIDSYSYLFTGCYNKHGTTCCAYFRFQKFQKRAIIMISLIIRYSNKILYMLLCYNMLKTNVMLWFFSSSFPLFWFLFLLSLVIFVLIIKKHFFFDIFFEFSAFESRNILRHDMRIGRIPLIAKYFVWTIT